MKLTMILLLSYAVLLPASEAKAQKAGWRVSYTIPRRQADDLASVFFHTRHVGWAVGDGHTNYTGIYKTTDGGQSWERLDLFDGQEHGPDFSAVRFADARHGWIATRTNRFVLRTTDGGETWEPMDVSENYVLANRILPFGVNGLLIASDNGFVHRTVDGGHSWESIRLQEEGKVLDIVRPTPDILYAIVSYRYGNSATFYRSDDGGTSWEALSEFQVPIGAIAFKDENNGVATGKDVAFHTADGGRTWKRTVAAGWRNAVVYVGDDLVGVGEDPHVLISRNGGRTWAAGPALPAPLPQQLHDIAVVDPGWWFAPSDREAKVYGFFDPENDHALGAGEIVVPRSMRGAQSGNRIPPGRYNALLRHTGYNHALVLTLKQPAEGNRIAVTGKQQLAENEFACTHCEAVIPVDLEYYEDGAPEKASATGGFKIGVEPSEDGVAIVIDARVLPPMTAVPYLAALGVTQNTDVEVKVEKKKSGGFLDRARKAAQGDLRGAVAGTNPKAATDRARAAKAVQAANPTFYNVRLRYNLPLTASKEAGQ
ncbi:MAG TPA: YCF48-related protein [Longimicrobiales bacterium]